MPSQHAARIRSGKSLVYTGGESNTMCLFFACPDITQSTCSTANHNKSASALAIEVRLGRHFGKWPHRACFLDPIAAQHVVWEASKRIHYLIYFSPENAEEPQFEMDIWARTTASCLKLLTTRNPTNWTLVSSDNFRSCFVTWKPLLDATTSLMTSHLRSSLERNIASLCLSYNWLARTGFASIRVRDTNCSSTKLWTPSWACRTCESTPRQWSIWFAVLLTRAFLLTQSFRLLAMFAGGVNDFHLWIFCDALLRCVFFGCAAVLWQLSVFSASRGIGLNTEETAFHSVFWRKKPRHRKTKITGAVLLNERKVCALTNFDAHQAKFRVSQSARELQLNNGAVERLFQRLKGFSTSLTKLIDWKYLFIDD